MKEITQSALQALYNSHPQAYFLIETVMHQASSKDWEAITEKADVVDEGRLNRTIGWHVERADDRWYSTQQETGQNQEPIDRYPLGHRFRFFRYKQVRAEIAPTTFVCRKCGYAVSLRKKIAENKLTKNDLSCPQCRIPLKQMVHVFGHPWCGELAEITPQRCLECREPASLIIDSIAFGRSAWVCPNGHKRQLSMNCPACTSLGEEKARMTPYAAGAAVKSVSVTMVDISTAIDWEEVVRKRLAVKQESMRQLILDQYKHDPIALKAIKYRLDSDEETRRQMYEQFLETHPELRSEQNALKQVLGGDPPFIIQRLLTEYHGTQEAAERTPKNPLNHSLRTLISERFHLFPRYIADLPILQI